MIIKLTDKQIQWCKNLGFKRSASKDHRPSQLKHKYNSQYNHFIGLLGELAYAIYSKQKVDTSIMTVGDNGIDFEDGTDVKTSTSKNRPDLLLFKKNFHKKNPKSYLLAWIKPDLKNHKEVELIGRINRDEILKVKRDVDFGYGDTYLIDKKYLYETW